MELLSLWTYRCPLFCTHFSPSVYDSNIHFYSHILKPDFYFRNLLNCLHKILLYRYILVYLTRYLFFKHEFYVNILLLEIPQQWMWGFDYVLCMESNILQNWSFKLYWLITAFNSLYSFFLLSLCVLEVFLTA